MSDDVKKLTDKAAAVAQPMGAPDEADLVVLNDLQTKLNAAIDSFLDNEVIADPVRRRAALLLALAQRTIMIEMLLDQHGVDDASRRILWAAAKVGIVREAAGMHAKACKDASCEFMTQLRAFSVAMGARFLDLGDRGAGTVSLAELISAVARAEAKSPEPPETEKKTEEKAPARKKSSKKTYLQ